MFKNPLQNIEPVETVTLLALGIVLLLTLEPVSQMQLVFAAILAGVLFIFVGSSVWGRRHDHR
ncbi:MAG: hypothetical protein U0521_28760 [Anaerolineae bacterium]